jgi:heterodisulfide reductase subunit A
MLSRRDFAAPRSTVFIQCVGSREEAHPYCSRVCCTTAVKNAIRIKEVNPDAEVFVLYRDVRTYGFREDYYVRARELGVQFLRFDAERKPEVTVDGSAVSVSVYDTLIGETVSIPADLVVLSSRIEANPDSVKLGPLFKVALNAEKFFLEAHVKLQPVDFATEGLFVCGLAHYPKDMSETISQALAAAGRAATILSKEKIQAEGKISYVQEKRCSGCGACEAVCAYRAIEMDPVKHVAVVNEALCKGCGACAATCRAAAIDLKGYRDDQILSVLNSL